MTERKGREKLLAKLQHQAEGPPSSLTQADCEDGTEILTWEQLVQVLQERQEEFLNLCNDEVDLAIWATELLEYFNGCRPEVEILPQRENEVPKFKVTLEPEP